MSTQAFYEAGKKLGEYFVNKFDSRGEETL